MHIDWFVFFAQIVNFLILVFALKYLLYGRIVKAMDDRQARIASELEEAQRMRQKAFEDAQAFEEQTRSLQEKAQDMLNKASQEAYDTRKELIDRAREEVDQIQQRWYETLGRERRTFLENLRKRSGTYVFDTIRRILYDLADQELEQSIVNMFVRIIRTSDEETLSLLRHSPSLQNAGIVIRSSFALSDAQKTMITGALKPYIRDDTEVAYETSTSMVAGIDMMAGGHKYSWSINEYIVSLEERFSHLLKEEIPTIKDA